MRPWFRPTHRLDCGDLGQVILPPYLSFLMCKMSIRTGGHRQSCSLLFGKRVPWWGIAPLSQWHYNVPANFKEGQSSRNSRRRGNSIGVVREVWAVEQDIKLELRQQRWHTHATVRKIDNQWEAAVRQHREPSLVPVKTWGWGWELEGGGWGGFETDM